MYKRLFVLFLALGLAGCVGSASVPTPSTDFGPPPTDIESSVKTYFEHTLIDPFSAHYEFGVPYKAYEIAPLIAGGGIEWQGWAVGVRVNSKNRFGGYVGWTTYHAFFKGNTVVEAYEEQEIDVLFHRID